ncbi:MAG: hypothetical protein IPK16_27945 [Anaerolineales bacterium]|nr:hypothetical protein [Anaerolineales bacterium]
MEPEAQLGQDSNSLAVESGQRETQTKSLRQASGKKAGGQSGHPGTTLTLQPEADSVVAHRPDHGTACTSWSQVRRPPHRSASRYSTCHR